MLAPTPPERLVDARGRPYFLWDEDITLDVFCSRLVDPDPEVRAYYLGKLMRQAKPDDVFTFATLSEISQLFPLLDRYLGHSREFGIWVLDQWKVVPPNGQRDLGSSVADVTNAQRHASVDVPAPMPIPDVQQSMAGAGITSMAETSHQFLVDKLCALLKRSDLRDLVDVRALVESGADLPGALRDCPRQDPGFSPMTFAWDAQRLPLHRVAGMQGWSEPEIRARDRFRQALVARDGRGAPERVELSKQLPRAIGPERERVPSEPLISSISATTSGDS